MNEDNVSREILTLAEAAAFIRVSEKTLGEMARTRRIPSQKVGREWRFLRMALVSWLAGDGANGVTDKADRTADELASVPSRVAEAAVQYELLPPAGFRDTAFSENHDRTLHRWVPWIAGFSGSFVAGVLDSVRTRRRRMRVLDPFAGVGTTLIEALKQGDDAVGYEINPYAALACRVKADANRYDVAALETAIAQFEEFGEDESWLHTDPATEPPDGFRSRVPFFSRTVERQVLACLDFIAQRTTGWLRELFRVAFGSVMVGFSNYSYEPSLGTRAGAGKPDVLHADVFGVVRRKLLEMLDDIATFQGWMKAHDPAPQATVHPFSYFDHPPGTDLQSIDALITSPPYLNNYHYVRNTRPHLFWLGMAQESGDLKGIEQGSFGRFWQTVRSGPEIALKPRLDHLTKQLRELRSLHPEKGAYGGAGWANYAAAYFNDCQRFCALTLPRMRPGGAVVVVIGNNILQGIEFKTDRLFAEIAEREGFEVVEMHEVRTKRIGNSIVNSSVRAGTVSHRTRLYETAVELRAPDAARQRSD